MKGTVIKDFIDKNTMKPYHIGVVYESEDEERIAYLAAAGYLKPLKEVAPEPEPAPEPAPEPESEPEPEPASEPAPEPESEPEPPKNNRSKKAKSGEK